MTEDIKQRAELPCPFCGTKDTLHYHCDDIICGGCNVSVNVDIWNNRELTAREEKLVEALKKLISQSGTTYSSRLQEQYRDEAITLLENLSLGE